MSGAGRSAGLGVGTVPTQLQTFVEAQGGPVYTANIAGAQSEHQGLWGVLNARGILRDSDSYLNAWDFGNVSKVLAELDISTTRLAEDVFQCQQRYRDQNQGDLARGSRWAGCCGPNNISGAPGTCVCGGDCGCSLNSGCEQVVGLHRAIVYGPSAAKSARVLMQLIGPDGEPRFEGSLPVEYPALESGWYAWSEGFLYVGLASVAGVGGVAGRPELWDPGKYLIRWTYTGAVTGTAEVAFDVVSDRKLTHRECVSGRCDEVSGVAADHCNPEDSCSRLECSRGLCTPLPYSGTDSANRCSTDTACRHKECRNFECIEVLVPGANTCSGAGDCRHRVCAGGQCVAIAGSGRDECEGDAQCAPVTKYSCLGGACAEDPAGAWDTAAACQANCTAPPPPPPPPVQPPPGTQPPPPVPPPPPVAPPDPLMPLVSAAMYTTGWAVLTHLFEELRRAR